MISTAVQRQDVQSSPQQQTLSNLILLPCTMPMHAHQAGNNQTNSQFLLLVHFLHGHFSIGKLLHAQAWPRRILIAAIWEGEAPTV
jgi:hypothetical protein